MSTVKGPLLRLIWAVANLMKTELLRSYGREAKDFLFKLCSLDMAVAL